MSRHPQFLRSVIRLFRCCVIGFIFAFLLAILPAQAIAQAKYTITDLGGNAAYVWDINNRGQVVGVTYAPQGPTAFVWDRVNGMVLLPVPCGDVANQSSAFSITNDGVIAGECNDQAVIWDSQNVPSQPGLPGCIFFRKINDSNVTVGFTIPHCPGDFSGSFSFRWSPGSGLQFLTDTGDARSINNSGTIVGINDDHATVWDNQGVHNLGTLGGTESRAYGINEAGQVVGGAYTSGNEFFHPFIWDSDHGMVDLAALTYTDGGVAYDVNVNGVVVGNANGGTFVWDSRNGMRNLSELIPPDSDWQLTDAVGINDRGQIIGRGIHAGLESSFILTPTNGPIIFIPGIAGSRLVDQSTGVELWPGGIFTDHTVLSLNPSTPPNPNIVATDAISSMTVGSGIFATTKVIYGPLLDMLTTRGEYRKYDVNNNPTRRTTAGCDLNQKSDNPDLNPNLFVFAYDWRKSNIQNAAALSDYVGCIEKFYPDTKVDIITHSMGGLLARRYILDHPGKVNRLFAIAPAWLGAPKSILTLETGDMNLGAVSDAVFVWRSTLKDISVFSPAVHELLPGNTYYSFTGHPLAERGDFNGNGIPDEEYSYAQQTDLLNQRYPQSGPGSNNVIFHNYPGQDDWSHDTTGVEYHLFLSRQRRDTTIGRVTAQRLNICTPSIAGTLICRDQEFFDTQVTQGDGTVPLRSSKQIGPINGSEVRLSEQDFFQYPGNSNFTDQQIEHTALAQLGNVHDFLLFFLGKGPEPFSYDMSGSLLPLKKSLVAQRQAPALARVFQSKRRGRLDKSRTELAHARSATRLTAANTNALPLTTPEPEPSYYLTVSGVDFVSITDEAGNTNTQISDTFALRVPGVTYDLIGNNAVFVSTPADRTFTFSFHVGSDPINLSILKGLDNITPSQAIRYRDVTLPAGATATLRVTASAIQDLSYDTNNDGVIDGIVNPTSALIGAAAADTSAPTITFTATPHQSDVTVAIATQDTGSGVRATYYSLDRVHYQQYTGALSVNPAQTPTIYAFADDNSANRSGMITFTVPPTLPTAPVLTALGPAQIWVGLKNSDDVGTRFDLLAEVFRNGALIGSGQINNIASGSSGFNNAKLNAINLALSGSPTLGTGDVLSIRLSVRVTASGGHRSGTARLWFNDAAANTRFTTSSGEGSATYYLRANSALAATAGSGPKNTIDVFVDRAVAGNPFKPFGTWAITF